MDPQLVNTVIQIGALGIVVAILQAVLNQAGKGEWALAVTVAGVIIVMFSIINLALRLFDAMRTLFPL